MSCPCAVCAWNHCSFIWCPFETGIEGHSGPSAKVPCCPTWSSVVAGGRKSQGNVHQDPPSHLECHYRCLAQWLGGGFLRKQNPCRYLVSRGIPAPHKFVRARNCGEGRQGPMRSCMGHEPNGLLRQLHLVGLHQKLCLKLCLKTLSFPLWFHQHDISVQASHKERKDNILADVLSRGWASQMKWALGPSWTNWLFLPLGHPNLDLWTGSRRKVKVDTKDIVIRGAHWGRPQGSCLEALTMFVACCLTVLSVLRCHSNALVTPTHLTEARGLTIVFGLYTLVHPLRGARVLLHILNT